MPNQKLHVETAGSHRWGVILAGGDGKRLLSLTRRIAGDDRPKQFCALTGGETLLQQTRRRVARLIPEHQTLLALTQTHERFYSEQVGGTPPSCLVIQPSNRGTAAAIVRCLKRLEQLGSDDQMDPDGVVAFFPSDHHFGDDAAFVENIDLAFAQADCDRERVILLGIAPEGPEESYGWIEPGVQLAGPGGGSICEVRRFWEKPSRKIASQLMRRGCLWNSFVMIGRVSAFLALVERTLPALLQSLEGGPAASFSDDVLAVCPAALSVLRADGLGWSDLGEPQRVYSVIADRADGTAHRLQLQMT